MSEIPVQIGLAGGPVPVGVPLAGWKPGPEKTWVPRPERHDALQRDPSPTKTARTRPDAECPLRPGDPCTLCQAFVTGPHDCQTVRLVMEDPDLKRELAKKRREWRQAHKKT
ncbi:MAG: hypothetical protein Q4B10_06495 [Actinomycetaceae bacterium]|nr:hypothetical protein [Actinomycetaceae bacterium]